VFCACRECVRRPGVMQHTHKHSHKHARSTHTFTHAHTHTTHTHTHTHTHAQRSTPLRFVRALPKQQERDQNKVGLYWFVVWPVRKFRQGVCDWRFGRRCAHSLFLSLNSPNVKMTMRPPDTQKKNSRARSRCIIVTVIITSARTRARAQYVVCVCVSLSCALSFAPSFDHKRTPSIYALARAQRGKRTYKKTAARVSTAKKKREQPKRSPHTRRVHLETISGAR
jgi:hypothetical protein